MLLNRQNHCISLWSILQRLQEKKKTSRFFFSLSLSMSTDVYTICLHRVVITDKHTTIHRQWKASMCIDAIAIFSSLAPVPLSNVAFRQCVLGEFWLILMWPFSRLVWLNAIEKLLNNSVIGLIIHKLLYK